MELKKEYQIKLNAKELNMILVSIKRHAAHLTQKAWGDLEPTFLELSDEYLALHNKIETEAKKQ